MSKKNTQRIEKLLVHQGIQEVVADEDRRLRYYLFMGQVVGALVVLDLILRSGLHTSQQVFLIVMVALFTPMLTAVIGPWHRRIVIDRNGPECRVERRFLYLLPVSSRTHAFEDRALTVGSITYTDTQKTGEGESSPWGCLLFLIPFPFSLLAGAFSKSDDKVITVQRRAPALMLRSPSTAKEVSLALVKTPEVAYPLLRAAAALLPRGSVVVSGESTPPE